MEPRYVDSEDIWEDYAWAHPQTDFERDVLKITGRVRFRTEAQAKRIRAIEGKMVGTSPKYPPDYVNEMLDWCRKMNRTATVITLDALISSIRNPDNLGRYYKGHPAQENRNGY